MKNKATVLLRDGFINFFIIVLGAGMLYPVLWLIAASFKETSMIFSDPGLIPKIVTLQIYIQGWKVIGIVGFGKF